jgi:hypothetical protein
MRHYKLNLFIKFTFIELLNLIILGYTKYDLTHKK